MCRFLVLATTVLTISLVEGFVPVHRTLNLVRDFQKFQYSLLRASSATEDSSAAKPDPPASSSKAEASSAAKEEDEVSSTTSKSVSKDESSPFDDIKDKLTVVMDQQNADQILGNILSGEFGQRGEVYVATQVFLVLCILFGGLPVLGDFLNFVCGPVLMAVGAGFCALGLVDMGSSLSPWPVPTGDELVTDGIYSKVRHPLYAGLLAIMAGFSVLTGSAPRLLLTAALWYTLDLKSDYEEKELIKEHAEYEAYQEEVPGKFFPQEIVALLPWTDSGDDKSDEA